jgi:hypothetical protein
MILVKIVLIIRHSGEHSDVTPESIIIQKEEFWILRQRRITRMTTVCWLNAKRV